MRDLSSVSSLIGSMNNSSNNNNIFNSINLSDYSMIKSGSYKKLMNSYYGTNKTDKSNNSVSSSDAVNKLSEATDKTGLTKMKAEADSLKKAASELNSDKMWDGSKSQDDITSAVKSFASKYNDVMEQSSKVKMDDSANNLDWMKSLTKTMSKTLDKVGITVGADNKLSIDEDKLASADTKTLKTLFSGDNSYGGQIQQKANNLSNVANTAGIYDSSANVSSALQSMLNVGI